MKEELVTAIFERAKNNKDREATIHPSEFGFDARDEGTQECKRYLEKTGKFFSVKKFQKDTLTVIVKEEFFIKGN